MNVPPPRTRLLREGGLHEGGDRHAAEVTSVELFFDLVYVFAFTQLSELLYEHVSWTGGAETAVIFVALWWAWSQTAWATGQVDPERVPVMALLAVLMMASLVMAASVLRSFSERGEALAFAYLATGLLRGGFMVWVFGPRERMGSNYAQLLGWSAVSGVIWVVGAEIGDPHTRLLVWAGAAVVDLLGPACGFWVPAAGAVHISDWRIAGGHLAERCQLLLMIAFGESFLRIGEAWAHRHGTPGSDGAFVTGFLLVVALWSVYFLHHARPGANSIKGAGRDAARLGRSAYLYAHAAMVGGVIVIAVAIHKTIESPLSGVGAGFAAICVGGPALFLAGLALSKRWLGHGSQAWPLAGICALALLGAATAFTRELVELIAVTVVAGALAVWVQARE